MQRMNTGSRKIKKIILSAMSKLGKEDYEILIELYFNHTSIHQLSKKLAISRPAVRYRRDKAIKNLKEIISEKEKKLITR